jgi:hypothetical protein
MRESILDEIDDQRGLAYQGMGARPYRWIYAMTTHGVVLPDVELLWADWWAATTVGRAVAVVQYASGLLYADDGNPVFAPWTRDGGGGPPWLWEFAGHLYSHRWLEANVEFLRRTLTASAVADVLQRAVKRLVDEPEYAMAARVLADVPTRSEMLAARCARLPELLATAQEPTTLLEW